MEIIPIEILKGLESVYRLELLCKGGFPVARSKYGWDEKKYKRYIKEGRGKGEGPHYQPWIKVRDISSKGWSTKAPGWKTGRIHHFISDNELRYFYLLEWSDIVIDIREQFPLLELKETIKIADEAGIRYPVDQESGFPYVLTTDFLITVLCEGEKIRIARTVKPSDELDKKRVIEKFEIERRYWENRGVDWGIVTQREIPEVMADNIERLHDVYELKPLDNVDTSTLLDIASILKQRLAFNDTSVKNALIDLDDEMQLEEGTSLYVLRHLIARKQVIVDMGKEIEIGKIIIERVTSDSNGGEAF